ncbi:uncharacterized protein LOC120935623 [Rana temporaria]|uniref:uncharacterized protein LOC120935623 n=1 Tax=Rana temporaria TaxID=8407 RepID=UPI001AAD259F|nr:uncharacterized protein LOC120935623 [Rana temporaria]
MIFRLFILFLFLHLVTSVEIKSIQTYHHELNVTAGQQLLIQCNFQLDEPLGGNKIKLAWSVKPPDEDEFQPIYQTEDTTQLTVKDVNRRAKMHLSDVHQGDCSLVIDPVHRDDAGTYDLRISINGEEFPEDTRVDVHIRESRVQIKSIQIYHHELNVEAGQQLLIPCYFQLNEPLGGNKIKLEWSRKPPGKDEFQPIYQFEDTTRLAVKDINIRTSMHWTNVRQGDCSLAINPVHRDEAGTYDLRIAINGEEFPAVTRVDVHISESRVAIKSIQTFHHELSVKAGQQLVIQCRFHLDEPLGGNKIKLQWSVKPPDEDEFQPIYQIEDTTVKDINSRARMNLSDVHQGDCSLVIDPVHRDDGGTYDLRIAINGEEFPSDTRVDVHIRESRVEIKSVQTYQHELNATVGQQLVIPCHFNMDKPHSNDVILMKWSMRPIGEDRFQPIVKVYDTKLLPLEHPTRTVSVDVPRVRQGICSLKISPVHLKDSGTYEVHLAINGDEYPGHTRFNIYVKESDMETDPNQPMNDQSRKASGNEDEDLMRMAGFLQGLKDNYSLQICGGVILLITLLSVILTIYFGCRYCRLKHKLVDDVKQMEEGRQCGLPVPTTYVSIPEENWHKGSPPVENWHKGSTPVENWHKGSNHIPTSSQVKVADPPPLLTAEERQRVLKRVRSKMRDCIKLKILQAESRGISEGRVGGK